MKLKHFKLIQFTELINYCWNNNIYDAEFKSRVCNESVVKIDGGKVVTKGVEDQDVFEICIYDDITENSVFNELVEYFKLQNGNHNVRHIEYATISEYKSHQSRAFYSLNEDMTMTLIWTKRKGLVE